jgi:hypothetical protein
MENIFYNTIVSTPASTPAYILMPAGEAEGTRGREVEASIRAGALARIGRS